MLTRGPEPGSDDRPDAPSGTAERARCPRVEVLPGPRHGPPQDHLSPDRVRLREAARSTPSGETRRPRVASPPVRSGFHLHRQSPWVPAARVGAFPSFRRSQDSTSPRRGANVTSCPGGLGEVLSGRGRLSSGCLAKVWGLLARVDTASEADLDTRGDGSRVSLERERAGEGSRERGGLRRARDRFEDLLVDLTGRAAGHMQVRVPAAVGGFEVAVVEGVKEVEG